MMRCPMHGTGAVTPSARTELRGGVRKKHRLVKRLVYGDRVGPGGFVAAGEVRSMTWFKKLAEGVTTHPWMVIGAWIVAGVLVIILSPQIVTFTSNNNSSFLPSSYESVQASQVAAKYFPAQAQASGIIVVSATDGGVLSSADQQKVAGLAQSLTADKIPSVETVTTSPALPLDQPEGATGPGGLRRTSRRPRAQQRGGDRCGTRPTSSWPAPGLVGRLTGNAAISVDSTKAFDSAELIITIATVVLILLLLGIVFRSVLISLLPIIVIGAVHQMAQAITADLADWFHFLVGPELAPLLVVVMFGVGTDYIVFLLFRYREHLANGETPGRGAADVADQGRARSSPRRRPPSSPPSPPSSWPRSSRCARSPPGSSWASPSCCWRP